MLVVLSSPFLIGQASGVYFCFITFGFVKYPERINRQEIFCIMYDALQNIEPQWLLMSLSFTEH